MTTKQSEPDQPLDLTQLLIVPKQEDDALQAQKIVKKSQANHKICDVLTLILVRIWNPLLMLATLGVHRYAKAHHKPKTDLTNEE